MRSAEALILPSAGLGTISHFRPNDDLTGASSAGGVPMDGVLKRYVARHSRDSEA